MKSRRRTDVMAVALVAALATPAVATGQAGEEAAVRETIDGFKTALQSGDGEAAMATLHAEARIFEGGHAETRDQYESGHLRGDMTFAAAVSSTTTWDDLSIRGDVAVYLREYNTTGTFRDREIDSHGTETMVLRKTEIGWKIWHVHWSSR